MMKNRPVILGLGNPLFQDEGLGIHVVHQLMQEKIAERVELIDGGTDAMSLLGIVEEANHLLIIDAVDGGLPPGSIRRAAGHEIPIFMSARLSPHQIGFQEVLAIAGIRRRQPSHLVLIGVQPLSTNWGTELTPPVIKSLPELTDMIYNQVQDWLCQ